jgi:general stress protein 26
VGEPAEEVRHVAELVDRARIGMLTTMTGSGKHVTRPMALQEVELDGDLWFFCYGDSAKALQIRSQPEVNVSFANDKQSEWTSPSGKAQVVYDRQQADGCGPAALKIWFPDGLDTQGLSLIKVHVHSAEYWESTSSKVRQLIGPARPAVTGDPDKFPATNRSVNL